MARALARGIGEPVLCTDGGSGRAKLLAQELGGEALASNAELAQRADVVVLAHEPEDLHEVAELSRLVAEDDEIGLLREGRVGRERLAPQLVDERLGTAWQHVGGEDRTTPAPREAARHVPRTDESDLHARHCSRRRGRAQLWLKKPFSINCARSSAEISTLRGVSMKTRSATR